MKIWKEIKILYNCTIVQIHGPPAQALGMPLGFSPNNCSKSDWPRELAIAKPTSCKLASSMPGRWLAPTRRHPRFSLSALRTKALTNVRQTSSACSTPWRMSLHKSTSFFSIFSVLLATNASAWDTMACDIDWPWDTLGRHPSRLFTNWRAASFIHCRERHRTCFRSSVRLCKYVGFFQCWHINDNLWLTNVRWTGHGSQQSALFHPVIQRSSQHKVGQVNTVVPGCHLFTKVPFWCQIQTWTAGPAIIDWHKCITLTCPCFDDRHPIEIALMLTLLTGQMPRASMVQPYLEWLAEFPTNQCTWLAIKRHTLALVVLSWLATYEPDANHWLHAAAQNGCCWSGKRKTSHCTGCNADQTCHCPG